jgi:Ca2+/Na+ antiporter
LPYWVSLSLKVWAALVSYNPFYESKGITAGLICFAIATLILVWPMHSTTLDVVVALAWVSLYCTYYVFLLIYRQKEQQKKQKRDQEFQSRTHIFKAENIIITYQIILDPLCTIPRTEQSIADELKEILRSNSKADLHLLQKPLGIKIENIQRRVHTDEGFSWATQ